MQLEVGAVVDGKVTGITGFGAFIELAEGVTGMVHISEVASTYVNDIHDFLQDGQTVRVKILSVGDNGKISLSIKKAAPPVHRSRPVAVSPGRPGGFEWQSPHGGDASNFEDMMSRFKQSSDEKMSDLKRSTDSKHGGGPRRGGPRSSQ